MADYPDIEFRLLLKMSERLRNANQQVLGLQGNLDEKLRVFNLKLDTEQRLVDVTLKAAQTMFDQTKLRADEVISSAERSRGRLQWAATVIGAFITAVIGVLGFIGAKQIYDINQVKNETASFRDGAKTASGDVKELKRRWSISSGRSRPAGRDQGRARRRPDGEGGARPPEAADGTAIDGLKDAKQTVSDILLSSLSDAVDRRLPNDANRFYTKLKEQKSWAMTR